MRLTKYNKIKTEQHRSWRVLALWPPVASDTASVPLHLAFLLPLFLLLLLILILRYGISPSAHRLLLLSFFSLHLLFLSCFLILLFGFPPILISIPDISCNQCTQEKHTLGVVFLSLCCLCLCICIPPSYILQSAHSRLALAHPGDRMIGCPWHAPTDIVPLSQQFGNSHPAQIQGPCDLPLSCDKDKYTNSQIHKYTNTWNSDTQMHIYTNTQIHKYMEF